MLKVNIQDLEEITKFLDRIANKEFYVKNPATSKDSKNAQKLSKMIKDKYTEIKA